MKSGALMLPHMKEGRWAGTNCGKRALEAELGLRLWSGVREWLNSPTADEGLEERAERSRRTGLGAGPLVLWAASAETAVEAKTATSPAFPLSSCHRVYHPLRSSSAYRHQICCTYSMPYWPPNCFEDNSIRYSRCNWLSATMWETNCWYWGNSSCCSSSIWGRVEWNCFIGRCLKWIQL